MNINNTLEKIAKPFMGIAPWILANPITNIHFIRNLLIYCLQL